MIPAINEKIFEYLKLCAKDMRTAEYKEIADLVGIDPRDVGKPLGYIRDEICRKKNLPWLNAIAVSKAKARPSHGFLPEDIKLSESEQEIFWRGMVLQVYTYDWQSVSFK